MRNNPKHLRERGKWGDGRKMGKRGNGLSIRRKGEQIFRTTGQSRS